MEDKGMTDVSPKGSEIADKSIVAENPIRQFNFSEEFIKKRNKVIGTIFIIGLPVVFLLLWMTTTWNLKILVSSFIITLITIVTLLVVELRFLNKAMRQTTLLIYKDKIVKSFGRNRETSAAWPQIDKVKLIKNPKGNHIQVIIYGENKEIMRLFGFDQMEEIANTIQRNLTTNSSTITKQLKLNPENPFWLILGVVLGIAVITVVSFGGAKIQDIFNLLLMAGVVIVAFIIKPVSKSNPNLKKLEMVIGWLAIIAIVFDLLGMLWPLLFGNK